VARRAHLLLALANQIAKARVREAHRLQIGKISPCRRQAIAANVLFDSDNLGNLAQEPEIDAGCRMHIFDGDPHPEGLGHNSQPVWRLLGEGFAQGAFIAERDLVESIEAGFE